MREKFFCCAGTSQHAPLAAPEIQVKIRFQSDSNVGVELENMGNLIIMR
jgi:hypothetical protein